MKEHSFNSQEVYAAMSKAKKVARVLIGVVVVVAIIAFGDIARDAIKCGKVYRGSMLEPYTRYTNYPNVYDVCENSGFEDEYSYMNDMVWEFRTTDSVQRVKDFYKSVQKREQPDFWKFDNSLKNDNSNNLLRLTTDFCSHVTISAKRKINGLTSIIIRSYRLPNGVGCDLS